MIGQVTTGTLLLLQAVVCGSLPAETACVRCPRHHDKFGGGLWYSLESGESVTLGQTSHHAPIYRVGAFSVKEDGGRVFVSKGSSAKSPALTLSEKINIRVHKVAKAVGCGCVSANAAVKKTPGHQAGWDWWSVAKVAKVSHDCLLIRLSGKPGLPGSGQAGEITQQHLWHISLRLNIQGQMVERDYTPISCLAEYQSGIITLWIRVYADGTLTPALQALLQPPPPPTPHQGLGGQPVPSFPRGFLGGVESASDVRGGEIQLQVLPCVCARECVYVCMCVAVVVLSAALSLCILHMLPW